MIISHTTGVIIKEMIVGMKFKCVCIFAVFSLLPFSLAYTASAQQPDNPKQPTTPASTPAPASALPSEELAKKLNLTPAQRQQMAAIEQKRQAAVTRLLPVLNAKNDVLTAVVKDPTASDAAIRKAVTEVAHVQIELKLIEIMAARAVDHVYTPEQHAQLKAETEKKKPADCACGNSSGGCSCGSGCAGGGGCH